MQKRRALEVFPVIVDCFTFFNELEILDIRLHELDSIVDKFVLVEARKTHSGKDKPLYYEKNKSLFSDYQNKIIHIIVDDFPVGDTYWTAENYQRNAIMNGLVDCKDNDIIMISDIDEIPRASRINSINLSQYFYVFNQRMHYYYLNTYFKDFIWRGTYLTEYKNLRNRSPQYFRDKIKKGALIESGGWHFSYMGGVEKIQEKLKSFAHVEFSDGKYVDKNYLDSCVKELRTFHTRTPRGQMIHEPNYDQNSFLPDYVVENINKFGKFIL